MKQEFEMLQAEMDDILQINKDQMPVMKIGNFTTGMDMQERVNAYWTGLGDKYGFKHMTVEGSAKGKLFFLAEPKPVVVPKTQTEKEIEKYVGDLPAIVKQLEFCEYETEAGCLSNNVAFLALKEMAIGQFTH